MARQMHRRSFIGTSAAISGGFFTLAGVDTRLSAYESPLDKLRIAGVGVGGKGSSDIDQGGNIGDVVALCDIDEGHLES